jgi:CHAT domain-containing protein
MPKADWRHPYYWAAFIPSGAWTTLDGKEPK